MRRQISIPSRPGRSQSSSAIVGGSADSSNLTASVPLPTATWSSPQSVRYPPTLCRSIYESSTRRIFMKHARLELGSSARHSQDDQRRTKGHELPVRELRTLWLRSRFGNFGHLLASLRAKDTLRAVRVLRLVRGRLTLSTRN